MGSRIPDDVWIVKAKQIGYVSLRRADKKAVVVCSFGHTTSVYLSNLAKGHGCQVCASLALRIEEFPEHEACGFKYVGRDVNPRNRMWECPAGHVTSNRPVRILKFGCRVCRHGQAVKKSKAHKKLMRQTDLPTRLRVLLRKRLHSAIRNDQKGGSAVRDLGCTAEEFKTYIEAFWEPGMTWDNWGKGPSTWQIDHIKPLCSFDLTQRERLLEACHFLNMQPLWHQDHARKSATEGSSVRRA